MYATQVEATNADLIKMLLQMQQNAKERTPHTNDSKELDSPRLNKPRPGTEKAVDDSSN